MSTVADIRRRIDALLVAVVPPRELMLLARMELLSDDQRAELDRHNDAVERWRATARAAGLDDAALYKSCCDFDDSHWWRIRPVLRRDVRELLYGPPPPSIADDDTVEQAARKFYEFAGIGITASSHRRGRR